MHDLIRDSRFKKDGVTRKTVPLLGKGFLHLVDNLFWNLPFSSVKQGIAVREKFNVPEEDWTNKWDFITAEHDKDGARQQLIDGWKSWIQTRQAQGGEGGEGGASAPRVDLDTIVMDE